jgi:formiminoglutamase
MFAALSQKQFKRFSRPEDPKDKRLMDVVEFVDLDFEEFDSQTLLTPFKKGDLLILGYPDDRGVERNGGRTGASEGPDELRRILYNFVVTEKMAKARIFDGGNLRSWGTSLTEAQNKLIEVLAALRGHGVRVLSLGGGHDWAYPDFVGLPKSLGGAPGYLVNFDAHLDVRPPGQDTQREIHSGMPFHKLLSEWGSENTKTFRTAAVGVQRTCNSEHHRLWAEAHRMTLQYLEDLPQSFDAAWKQILDRLELSEKQDIGIGLSLDLDVFAQSIAPGVSAPQALGIDPWIVDRFIDVFAGQIKHFGIYELSPRLDRDSQTARLAARFAFRWLGA